MRQLRKIVEVIHESLLYGFRVDHQEVPFFEWVGRVAAGGREMCLASNHSRFKWTGGNGSKKQRRREREIERDREREGERERERER